MTSCLFVWFLELICHPSDLAVAGYLLASVAYLSLRQLWAVVGQTRKEWLYLKYCFRDKKEGCVSPSCGWSVQKGLKSILGRWPVAFLGQETAVAIRQRSGYGDRLEAGWLGWPRDSYWPPHRITCPSWIERQSYLLWLHFSTGNDLLKLF